MANPMKIRLALQGDVVEVRVLVDHPMETGQRKDGSGNPIPAHFIQTLTVALNGKTMVDSQIGASVSAKPVFAFKIKGAKSGDKVTISWIDNKGDKRTDEETIK